MAVAAVAVLLSIGCHKMRLHENSSRTDPADEHKEKLSVSHFLQTNCHEGNGLHASRFFGER
jgi:hypothetical protein